ncbi:hypothetical protein BGZ61DRAFT_371055 [Ilyonectria robusta]|uniref:uncharacterized protein n=1 Tax=Ilyonectria robusta TaxID=1079257 RepID=UPI001E8DC459|nr:uncharacterized protein BGZ61DRAFT_371055 [Ilyonectria robusta]KAH8658537.1 hypothetical protein BGZ61DRAFT_371055 [Ilyonectria robusta]
MEFIPINHPAQSSLTDLRRRAHSHAARVAHARARKAQVANFMRQKELSGEKCHNKQQSHDQPPDQSWTAVTHQQVNQTSGSHPDLTPIAQSITSDTVDHGPFGKFLQSLTFVEHFMFNHYVQVVLPYLNFHCPVLKNVGESSEYMRKNWIFLSSTDADFLQGFLLAACRHLSMVNLDGDYAQFAIQYKLRYIQSLRQAISSDNPSSCRIAVTKALVLTLDEIMLGDLSMASKHVVAAVNIIQMCGGSRALGLSNFVIYILNNCIKGKRLLEPQPSSSCTDTFMKPGSI